MAIWSWLKPKRHRPVTEDFSMELSMAEKSALLGITCTGKRDGGGAQVQAVMSAILFSRAVGVPYFHTPFKSMMHGNEPKRFAARWEEAFNLGIGAASVPAGVPIITGEAFNKQHGTTPAVVAQPYFHSFADANPDFYRTIVDQFRAGLALPPRSFASPTIAVHVRRGDVVGRPAEANRVTDNDTVTRHIETALRDHPGYRVVVFSQGVEADFQTLPKICEFELNSDIFWTISGLIQADCLIMAKSSLSYVAGLLSKGTVYYEPFWHGPLSTWRVLPKAR
jgi:hypothetical protein